LNEGDMLMFAHGFNIHFGLISWMHSKYAFLGS
ncbi:MAG: hypothetical protein HXM40_06775, partial [Stomatobaculum longum]|nr:hypothetical protein [Stomatobaculum longum]